MFCARLCVSLLVIGQTVTAPVPTARGLVDGAGVVSLSERGSLARDRGDAGGLRLSPRAADEPSAQVEPARASGAGESSRAREEEASLGEAADDAAVTPSAPAPRVAEPQTRALRVAVGLSEDAPGSKAELEFVDALEAAMEAAEAPTAQVRRLRSGAAVARRVCAEGRDDLVLTIGYLPDREGAVVFTYDCLLGRELGVRGAAAANSAGLLGALWQEHRSAVADGATERRRGRLNPKVRAGLIAGGALLAIGVAVGFVLASTLRDEVTVITVSP